MKEQKRLKELDADGKKHNRYNKYWVNVDRRSLKCY